MSQSTAVEKAKDKLKEATSTSEEAFLLAELIHGLGLQAKSAEFTALANGQQKDSEFAPGKSIDQHISECEERITELWKKADEDGIGRRDVETALSEVQTTWRKRVAEPQPSNGRVE